MTAAAAAAAGAAAGGVVAVFVLAIASHNHFVCECVLLFYLISH